MQPSNEYVSSYYFQHHIDEDYDKVLEARKLDSQDFIKSCENNYHHKKVDVYMGSDHHNKQFPYPLENK